MDEETKRRVDAMWGKLGIGPRSEVRGAREGPPALEDTAARVAGR
jgi:hypothetical protein